MTAPLLWNFQRKDTQGYSPLRGSSPIAIPSPFWPSLSKTDKGKSFKFTLFPQPHNSQPEISKRQNAANWGKANQITSEQHILSVWPSLSCVSVGLTSRGGGVGSPCWITKACGSYLFGSLGYVWGSCKQLLNQVLSVLQNKCSQQFNTKYHT